MRGDRVNRDVLSASRWFWLDGEQYANRDGTKRGCNIERDGGVWVANLGTVAVLERYLDTPKAVIARWLPSYLRATPRPLTVFPSFTAAGRCAAMTALDVFHMKNGRDVDDSETGQMDALRGVTRATQAFASSLPDDTRRQMQHARLMDVCRNLLRTIGEDPSRDGLRETPRRWASAWMEFVEYDPGTTDTVFDAVGVDQMVVLSGMRVWSMCEHHLLPFWCDVAVGYITDDVAVGISKLARIAHRESHALNTQEAMVERIAFAVQEVAGTRNVGVMARGEHLCMTMRGAKTPALMSSSSLHGLFRDDAATRAEFMRLAGV